ADDTLPRDSVRIGQFLSRPQMRYIVRWRWWIPIPVIGKGVEHCGGSVATCAVRIGGRPRMLIGDREGQADVSLIDRGNRIHDAKDVAVGGRRASQGIRVFEIRLSCEF